MKNDVVLKMDKVSYRYSDAPKDVYVFKNLSYEFNSGKMYGKKRNWTNATI